VGELKSGAGRLGRLQRSCATEVPRELAQAFEALGERRVGGEHPERVDLESLHVASSGSITVPP
jgi:hypothetical protein